MSSPHVASQLHFRKSRSGFRSEVDWIKISSPARRRGYGSYSRFLDHKRPTQTPKVEYCYTRVQINSVQSLSNSRSQHSQLSVDIPCRELDLHHITGKSQLRYAFYDLFFLKAVPRNLAIFYLDHLSCSSIL